MSKPLAIDICCGLGGWTEGLLAEGFDVVGFDTVRHMYGEAQYPAQLVIQDVLTLHGAQFKDAALIVASPPCQAYSYRAMPWKKAKALPPPDNALFEACFRIQREAEEAAGGPIPLVVENVLGAQKWVGRARWHYGSFYLWGDVPALMPIKRRAKVGGFRFDGGGKSFKSESVKVSGLNWSNFGKAGYKAEAFNTTAEQRMRRDPSDCECGHSPAWHDPPDWHCAAEGCNCKSYRRHGRNSIANAADGHKQRGSGAAWWRGEVGSFSSKSSARKAASAHIAKIPFELARHIARAWYPEALPLEVA